MSLWERHDADDCYETDEEERMADEKAAAARFDEFKTGERPLNGGVQKVYEFPSGWGASVVRHRFSYGSDAGLWELAVLDKDGDLNYSTTITNDVEGGLEWAEVEALLERIKNLPEDGQEPGAETPERPGLARGLEALASLADAAKSGALFTPPPPFEGRTPRGFGTEDEQESGS